MTGSFYYHHQMYLESFAMTAKLITGLFLMTLALLAGCAGEPLEPEILGPTGGWEAMRPSPAGQALDGVWSDGPENVWGVGTFGAIVHWNGERTLEVDSPTNDHIVDIDGWAADDLYAAAGSQVLHFDGRTWETHSQGEDRAFTCVLCGPDGQLYAAGYSGLLVFQDGNWRRIPGPGDGEVLWVGPNQQVRMISEGDQVWVVQDGEAQLEQDFPTLWIKDGDGSYLIARDHGGHDQLFTWSAGSGWSMDEEIGSSARVVLDLGLAVIADNSGVRRVHDQLQLWENNVGRWIYALKKVGDRELVAAGSSGTLLYFSLDSEEWPFAVTDNFQGPGYSAVNCLTGTSDQDIWAGEWYSRVLHYDGSTWVREYAGLPYASVDKIQVFGDGWVAAAADNGVSLRRPDTGDWTPLPLASTTIGQMQAISPDSIMVSIYWGYQLWNGSHWSDLEAQDGRVRGLTRTAAGILFSLESDEDATLKTWSGEEFETVLRISGFKGESLWASRASETIWLAGRVSTSAENTMVYRYRDGMLDLVSEGVPLPQVIRGVVDHGPDDIFLSAYNALWRFHDGAWTSEQGLPENSDLEAIWASPEGGVYVQGHTLYYKNYAQE
jgi:hypothetical protein